jgi:phage baseplate assembly protein W
MKKDVDHVLDENRKLQAMYNDKISNVLLTKPGERLFDNQFGSLLQNYLFGDDNNTDK